MQSTIKSKLSLLISTARLQELVLGVRGQAGRSATLDPLTNICNRRVTPDSAGASDTALLYHESECTALRVKMVKKRL